MYIINFIDIVSLVSRPYYLSPVATVLHNKLGRISLLCRCGLLLQTEQRGLSVRRRSVTVLSPAKMAEPIEVPFGVWTRVRPRNHVLFDGGPDPSCEWAVLRGKRHMHGKWLAERARSTLSIA